MTLDSDAAPRTRSRTRPATSNAAAARAATAPSVAVPPVASPILELSDAELDAYVLTRLRAAGVELGVLPEDDPDAPADRRRVLEGARRFLRSTPPAILAFEMDEQLVAPAMYPAAHAPRREVR